MDFFKTAFVTLLVTLDPPGLAPIFIALTLGMTKLEKHEVAVRASIIGFAILFVFAPRRQRGHGRTRHFAARIPDRRRSAAVLYGLSNDLRRARPAQERTRDPMPSRSITSAISPPFRSPCP